MLRIFFRCSNVCQDLQLISTSQGETIMDGTVSDCYEYILPIVLSGEQYTYFAAWKVLNVVIPC